LWVPTLNEKTAAFFTVKFLLLQSGCSAAIGAGEQAAQPVGQAGLPASIFVCVLWLFHAHFSFVSSSGAQPLTFTFDPSLNNSRQ
jgi:hypothetical protein